AVGDWLRTYGTSVYGTRGGPVPPREWGVTTRRGDTVFVHVLNWPDRLLSLPDFGARVVKASVLKSGERVEVVQAANGVILSLPPVVADEPDRVIVLVTQRNR
ncbi:MAG: alpha-L-fucosidase, partial [Gemmatimonadetes bacterium]|nr:alpha-L-fucosidase [Gemmatimonadota bacterium]